MRTGYRWHTTGVLAFAMAGCAGAPPAPSEVVRAQAKSIAVVAADRGALPDSAPVLTGPDTSAARGAADGATHALIVGGPLFVPIGAIVGAVVGGLSSAPTIEIEFIQSQLDRIPKTGELQTALHQDVVSIARKLQSRPITAFDLKQAAVTPPDYSALSERGIDTVLEVTLRSAGLIAGRGKNPPVAFRVTADVRLIRIADSAILYARPFQRIGAVYPLSIWQTRASAALGRDIESAIAALAQTIVEEAFLMWRPS